MAQRGRKPASLALKIARGDTPARLGLDVPGVSYSIPEPPEIVRNNPEVFEEWNRIVGLLVEMKTVSKVDRPGLVLYCAAYRRFLEAQKMLEEEGYTETRGTGALMASPWVGIAERSGRFMRNLLGDFGLLPSTRHKVRESEPVKQDELADFISRKTKSSRPIEPLKTGHRSSPKEKE
jgi:P27 family predicted phage terminase small subunit